MINGLLATSRVVFTILGKPQQRGSKQAHVRYDRMGQPVTKNGRVLTFAKDDNANSKEWMNLVRDKASEAMAGADPMSGPVVLTVRFYFSRPDAHYGSGKNADKLKPSAPTEHAQTPDLSKLLRCVEDGMSSLVYGDDKQVSRYGTGTGKYWTTGASRAEISIEALSNPCVRRPTPYRSVCRVMH